VTPAIRAALDALYARARGPGLVDLRLDLERAITAALPSGEAVAWLLLDGDESTGHRVVRSTTDPAEGIRWRALGKPVEPLVVRGRGVVPLIVGAPAPVLTVGAALALPEVQRGEAVVEFKRPDGNVIQLRVAGSDIGERWRERGGWDYWYPADCVTARTAGRTLALLARLVPLATADESPDTRGPLPAKETTP
jgi:hypothetical protein